ncbi:MAG: iron-containing alcohol dehydrogenase [Lachnospiraceae bacterium]|nr:iron-containing alcohol dehydrogenase [Lachnospiraceae bacterium]
MPKICMREMNRSMEIPDKIAGIQEADIRQMAAHADKESNPLYPVPRLMDADELAVMYRKIAAQEDGNPQDAVKKMAAQSRKEAGQWKSAIS